VSDPTAISAVTSLLQRLLETRLQAFDTNTQVTTKAPDKARTGTTPQLNLFLFQATVNAAWRNMDPPRQVRPGETAHPALALDLHYLVTAYGAADDDLDGHRVLGRSLSVLHDTPILNRNDPLARTAGLHEQFENLRVSPESLSLEELSKLWATFQTNYRISSAFAVSVVLIDSTRAPRSPLPVLTRGAGDRGVTTLAARLPVLTAAVPPPGIPAVRLGETLTLLGSHLDQSGIVLRFDNFRRPAPIELTPSPGGNAERLLVRLPDLASDPTAFETWAAGIYTVSAVVQRPGLPAWSSNELVFALAPTIRVTPNSTSGSVSAGDALTIESTPHVLPSQSLRLLFGDRQLTPTNTVAPADPADPTVFTFEVPALPPGDYPLRLRVDGADSAPIRSSAPPLPEFDPEQTVTVA
jgi:hypothetical protein